MTLSEVFLWARKDGRLRKEKTDCTFNHLYQKKFKNALLNLMKAYYLKDFEDDEMKEGTGHTTYACMTIVIHED